jgi:serine/threonine-protein kinase
MQGGENFDVSSRVVTSPSVMVIAQPQSKLLWTVVVIAVLAATVAIAALVLILRNSAQNAQPSSVVQIPTPVPTSPSTAVEQPTATATQAPTAQPTATATATLSPTAKGQTPPKASAKAPATTATGKTDTPNTDSKPDHPAKSECTPPYTIDARGVRVPKPQCL